MTPFWAAFIGSASGALVDNITWCYFIAPWLMRRGRDRWEELLMYDWGDAWEHLPPAPPLPWEEQT